MEVLTEDAKASLMAKYASSIEEVETPEGNETDDDGNKGDDGKGSGEGDDDEGEKGAGGSGNPGGAGSGDGGDGDGSDDDNKSTTPISFLLETYGYDKDDERFKDLNLEDDSVEGIKAFYDKREEIVKQEALTGLLEEVPVVKELIQHLKTGATVDSWRELKKAEAFKVDFEEGDIDGKKEFLKKIYTERGLSEKQATRVIEALIDDNELDDEVTKEGTAYKTKLTEAAAKKAEAEAKEAEDNEKKEKEIIAQVSGIVKKGNLANVAVIPEKERETFNKFIFSNDIGAKYEKLTYDQRLLLDYIVFKDFKLDALVKPVAKSSGNNKDDKGSGNKTRVVLKNNQGSGGVEEISLEDLRKLSKRQ